MEKLTEGSTEYCLLCHSSLPDFDDLVILKLRDAGGQSYEEVHPAEHEASDEGVDSDDEHVFLVLQLHGAQR